MNSTKGLLHQINDPTISPEKRAQLRCSLAKRLEQAWNFEAAREAMGHLWQRIGEPPDLKGLDEYTKGEVLLRAGALTGWIGSTTQIEGAQETAKNLITQSIFIFESLNRPEKISETQIELAYCYWRQGGFDNARAILEEALARPDQLDQDVRALGVLRKAIVEESTNRFHDALSILKQAAPLFETLDNDALAGKFHNEFGFVLRNLFAAEQRSEYLDQALVEYAAAGFHFEQAKLSRHQACVENNLGFLYGTIGKFREAHEHLDHAQAIFTCLGDSVHLAQVDETRSRVMIGEGQFSHAEKLVKRAVETLQTGGEQPLLAEALITQGVALTRLHNYQQAHSVFTRAIETAEHAGDLEGAGKAHLTLLEELNQYLSNDELCASVERARHLLENTQDFAVQKRLARCACDTLLLISAHPMQPDWTRFSWKQAMLRYEAHFIGLALRDAGGSVTEAARLLGIAHHQSLSSILQKRHKQLLHARSAIVSRKRRLIGEHDSAQPPARTILHIEDDELV
jgi:tetratricopeptide (TPR) repeat protein